METKMRDDNARDRPFWDSLSAPVSLWPHLDRDIDVDIAVVGGGIVGLCVALAAAESGADTILLEESRIGAGASGRNSGFVAPALRALPGGRKIADYYGNVAADRFRALAAKSGEKVFETIDRHSLNVRTSRTGWIAAAHTVAEFNRLLREKAAADVELNSKCLERLSGIPGWVGGVLYRGSGAIDPLAYVNELARAAAGAGARICEASQVDMVKSSGDGVVVSCGEFQVKARHAILATNGQDRLVDQLSRSLLVVQPYQIATQVLPVQLQREILPEGHVVTDTRRNALAIRWTPDGRLLTGGLIGPTLRPQQAAAANFVRRLKTFMAEAATRAGVPLKDISAEFVWKGPISLTSSGLPQLYTPSPEITALVACNGRGIALGTALGLQLGEIVAQSLLAGRWPDLDELPVPSSRPPRSWLRPFAELGSRIRVPYAEWRDRQDINNERTKPKR